MGCLSVSARRIGSNIVCEAFRLNNGVNIAVCRIGKPISCKAEPLNDKLNVSVLRLGDRLNVSVSLICTLNKSAFLNVNPDYVWLTSDMLSSGEFDIISNIKWNIV